MRIGCRRHTLRVITKTVKLVEQRVDGRRVEARHVTTPFGAEEVVEEPRRVTSRESVLRPHEQVKRSFVNDCGSLRPIGSSEDLGNVESQLGQGCCNYWLDNHEAWAVLVIGGR